MPEGHLGTLEEGKIVDMVLLTGNPLEDITLLQNPDNIAAVIKEGEIYTDLLANQSPHHKNAAALGQLLRTTPCN